MNTIVEKTGLLMEISKKEYGELKRLISMCDKFSTEAVADYYRNDDSKEIVDIIKKWCKNLGVDSETARLLKKKADERKKILKSAV